MNSSYRFYFLTHKFYLDAHRVTRRELCGGGTLSTGLDKSGVDALNRSGQVWEFKIPVSVFKDWEKEGIITRFRDLDCTTGVINEKIRISGRVANDLNKYKVK